MSLHWPQPGVNHVGEFQASGHTFVVTGSSNIIKLKYVASSITLSVVSGSDLDATFYDSSHVGMPFTVPSGTTARFKGKFLTFNIPVGMDALVEVTNIPSGSYLVPSGSQMHTI